MRLDAARFLALTAALATGACGAGPATPPESAAAAKPVSVTVAPVDPEENAEDEEELVETVAEATDPNPSTEGDGPPNYEGGSASSEAAILRALSAPTAEGVVGVLGQGYGAVGGFGGGLGGLSLTQRGPRVTPGASSTQGSLDGAIIRRVVRQNLARIRHCYQIELAQSPTLDTKIVTKFVIGPQGQVTNATVQQGSGRSSFDQCVNDVVKRMSFPAPKGGNVTVSYPFVFKNHK